MFSKKPKKPTVEILHPLEERPEVTLVVLSNGRYGIVWDGCPWDDAAKARVLAALPEHLRAKPSPEAYPRTAEEIAELKAAEKAREEAMREAQEASAALWDCRDRLTAAEAAESGVAEARQAVHVAQQRADVLRGKDLEARQHFYRTSRRVAEAAARRRVRRHNPIDPGRPLTQDEIDAHGGVREAGLAILEAGK